MPFKALKVVGKTRAFPTAVSKHTKSIDLGNLCSSKTFIGGFCGIKLGDVGSGCLRLWSNKDYIVRKVSISFFIVPGGTKQKDIRDKKEQYFHWT